MCGIAGIFNFNTDRPVDRATLEKMTGVIDYRGPDDEQFYVKGHCGLGFRRLSIVGLENGQQPMCNSDKNVHLICNGEIYNYRELREGLISQGYSFHSDSDVEVLLYLYLEYGTAFLNKLNGQFAFAIYDETKNRLFLARDQVGIAPLFYSIVDNQFIFGSEIKALLQHPDITAEADLTGLDQVLTFPGPVSPRTLFKNISSLEPGHMLVLEGGSLTNEQYWDLDYPEAGGQSTRSEEDYVEELDALLKQSVNYRMNADVPVGFYLSGGMDSSLIAALINEHDPSKARPSFSIGFNDTSIDERNFQQIMVEQVGSQHHETLFDWQQISTRLKKAIYHAECPLKETYNTCSLALSQLVQQQNIKVILTGEGADEIFGGYVGYRLDEQRNSDRDGDPFSLEAMMENELREEMWGDENLLYEKNYYEHREIKRALYSEELASNLDSFDCTQKPLVNRDKLRGRSPLHQRSYLDFKLRMSDHLLADHGDRVALAHSVEARYPFLDINILEYAKRLPPEYMVKDGSEKYILRQVAKKYLPESIMQRKKFAFVAPGSPALLKQDIEWVNDMLSYDSIKQAGYFNPDTVERLRKQYLGGNFQLNTTFDSDLLLIVLTFGIFKEIFNITGHQ